jgi:hypothetical protein
MRPVSRLIEALLALACLGFTIAIAAPVAATFFTPGWLEGARLRHWASMTFFLSVAAVFLFLALRLIRHSSKGGRRILRSTDWWAIAALCVVATVAAGIASYWTIALPGLLPIAVASFFARRRARDDRLKVVDGDASDLPPRATFATERSSGPRAV